ALITTGGISEASIGCCFIFIWYLAGFIVLKQEVTSTIKTKIQIASFSFISCLLCHSCICFEKLLIFLFKLHLTLLRMSDRRYQLFVACHRKLFCLNLV